VNAGVAHPPEPRPDTVTRSIRALPPGLRLLSASCHGGSPGVRFSRSLPVSAPYGSRIASSRDQRTRPAHGGAPGERRRSSVLPRLEVKGGGRPAHVRRGRLPTRSLPAAARAPLRGPRQGPPRSPSATSWPAAIEFGSDGGPARPRWSPAVCTPTPTASPAWRSSSAPAGLRSASRPSAVRPTTRTPHAATASPTASTVSLLGATSATGSPSRANRQAADRPIPDRPDHHCSGHGSSLHTPLGDGFRRPGGRGRRLRRRAGRRRSRRTPLRPPRGPAPAGWG